MKIDINKVFWFFLPFTQALAINFIFPLKISEIALFFLLYHSLNNNVISTSSIWFFKQNKLLLIFAVIATTSFILNIYWHYDYPPKYMPYRLNRVGDSFIRLCYLFLCIIAFYFSFRRLRDKINILDYWIYGALIASIYGWYIFVSSYLNLPYFKLPGMEKSPQMLNGLIRCGTFKEGNFFGLFLILSAAVSLYRKKYFFGLFFLISIIITMSTISIVSSIVFIIYYYRKKIINQKIIKIAPFLIIFLLFFINTDYYKKYVQKKIFEQSIILSYNNYSKIERSTTALTAYYMGINNPFFGVGPANYSPHFDKYNSYKKIIKRTDKWIDIAFSRYNERVIPNNVYMEIWCEYGILGFIFFVSYLIFILIKAIKIREDAITGGIISMLISLNAFPSFIMFFLWVFISIPFAIDWIKKQKINQYE